MSRILRRPMFRGGPMKMEGIMSGIKDRQNYADGSATEQLMKVFEEYPNKGIDPVYQLAIQGGLNLMSQTPRGGLLATASEAFKQPTADLFKAIGSEQKLKRELALTGAKMDIEQKQALELAKEKEKNKEIYAAQLYETQVEKMRDNLVDAAEARIISKFKGAKADDISRKTTDFIMQAPSSLKGNLIDIDYVDIGKKGVSQFVPDLSNVQVGQIFYDATLGQWKKRVGEGQGRLDFVTLDPYSGYREIEIDQ